MAASHLQELPLALPPSSDSNAIRGFPLRPPILSTAMPSRWWLASRRVHLPCWQRDSTARS